MTGLRLAGSSALFVVVMSAPAQAQCTPGGEPSPAAVKGAIVGIVMDTSHHPLSGVDVLTRNPLRSVRTDDRGRFTLTDLSAGKQELTVRKIGYEIAVQTIAITESGGVARFCLIPEPRALPAMISSVPRGGVSGVVGDSTYAVLPGAEVKPVAGGAAAITDSAGGFFLDLKPGPYVLTVKKAGFGTQMVSVTVPKDSGRQIAVWLASPLNNPNRMTQNLDEMRTRILLAKPWDPFTPPGSANRAKLFTSEDVAKAYDLISLISTFAVLPLRDCEAIIDGGPFTLPCSIIDKSEIAAVEVYLGPPDRGGAKSANPAGTAGGKQPAGQAPLTVYVWMKP